MSSLHTHSVSSFSIWPTCPQSSKQKPLFQQHLFSRTITQNLLSGSIFSRQTQISLGYRNELNWVLFCFPPAPEGVQRWLSPPILHFWKFSLLWLSFIFPFSLYPWSVGWILAPSPWAACSSTSSSRQVLWCTLPRLQVCVPDMSAERVAALHLHVWPTT